MDSPPGLLRVHAAVARLADVVVMVMVVVVVLLLLRGLHVAAQ